MDGKKIIMSVFKSVITLAFAALIIMLIYNVMLKAYDFGYRIFAEEPMSPAPGLTMSVAIVEGKSVREIGEILEEKGLIRSASLFYLQELVSSYHGELQPGIYELSTAMTPNEMMEIMAANAPEDEEDEEEEK